MHAPMKRVCAATLAAVAAELVWAQGGDVSAPSPEQMARERMIMRSQLDQRLEQESRVADWADGVERDIQLTLAEVAHLDLEVREIECRASRCRVILDHVTQTGQQDVMQATAGMPGFDLAGQALLEVFDDGTATSYIYLHTGEPDGVAVAD
jgi:hypothetical protein